MDSPKKFKTAVLGGTFDHFHKGHKNFLEHGLSISERLMIGVTSDEYVKNLKSQKYISKLKIFRKFYSQEKEYRGLSKSKRKE